MMGVQMPLGDDSAWECEAYDRLPQRCLRWPKPEIILPAFPASRYALNRLTELVRLFLNTDDGPTVHLGGTHVSRGDWAAVSPYPAVAAIEGLGLAGILASIPSFMGILLRATAVHLHVGPEDIRAGVPVATMQAQMGDLMWWITGPLVVTLVTYQGSTDWQAETTAVNDAIRVLAAEHPQCVVVDLNPLLAPGGTLLPEYNWESDGLHYNREAYRAWYPMVREALAELGVPGFARSMWVKPPPLLLS